MVTVELELVAELDNFISVYADRVTGDGLNVFDLKKKPIGFLAVGGGAAFMETFFSASFSSFQTLLVLAIKTFLSSKNFSPLLPLLIHKAFVHSFRHRII